MITAEHIKSLLELQKATNVAYFGEEWRKHWTHVAVMNSIYREWAEFLDETTQDWKIYGGGIQYDREAAVYELVDVVHFMLSSILSGFGSAFPVEMQIDIFFKDGRVIDKSANLESVTECFTSFMEQPDVIRFVRFLSKACGYLDLDTETYMLAHKRKNDRNRLRAAGGANYDKSAETPLTLEF
ncbi:nucleoside triphosphate pyrophosphohydrolase [Salmonella phage maane]|uniref:Putative dUTP diphosphatase n=1 Tax=Salmonella phage maane TaxID=2713304 RepID=A0A6G8RQ26_9CAUD|nr:nucleoside triphosphate pyrophosphohydrolase [Salmonella phage maane]QIO03528.1 putative dUTP diphosphatase [Salmonella phage maane]